MELEEIKTLMRKSLKDNFRFFDENHIVNAGRFSGGKIWTHYRTSAENAFSIPGTTHLDVELIEDICYLLEVEIDLRQRGKGIGWELYESVHKFAKDYGSKVVRLTPSGFSIHDTKRTRRAYLLNRGYIPFDDVEVEFVL